MRELIDKVKFWWQDPWWEAEQYSRAYKDRFSHETVAKYVAALSRIFDPSWAEGAIEHPAWNYLLMRGLNPLEWLISVGRNLILVEQSPGFRHIIDGLRQASSFDATLLELSLAAVLREAGHEIEFHPLLPNKKRSDVIARIHGQEVFFELKHLRESDLTLTVDGFAQWLGRTIDECLRSACGQIEEWGYQVRLDPGLADFFAAGEKQNEDFHEMLAHQVSTLIRESLLKGVYAFGIRRIGTFHFQSKANCPEASIVHDFASSIVELKRITRNRLHGALDQLPNDKPGIIVFRTAGALDAEEARQAMCALLGRAELETSHVSAVLIFPKVYKIVTPVSLFEPFAVENPIAAFPPESLFAYRTLISKCGVRRRIN